MSVTQQVPYTSATANGITTAFNFEFELRDTDDLLVLVDDVLQTTGYTVTGLNDPGGGTVTFSAAPDDGAVVEMKRQVVLERLTDFQEKGDLPASTLNADLDRVLMALQDQYRDIDVVVVQLDGISTDTSAAVAAAQLAATNAQTAETNAETAETNAEAAQAAAEAAQASAEAAAASVSGVSLSAANTWTAAQRGAIHALTDGATITPDFSAKNFFSVTLGGNRTLANPTNIVAGQSGSIFITQDGTGSRTLAYGSYFKFPFGSVPTLTTTASAVDRLDYIVETTTRIHASLTKGVA